MLISFLGSLPPGSINLTGAYLLHENGWMSLVYFLVGDVLVEMIFVWFTLYAVAWLRKKAHFFVVLDLVSFLTVLIFSFASLYAAFNLTDEVEQVNLTTNNAFLLGVTLSFLNPLHIPFWLVWINYFEEKKLPVSSMFERLMFVFSLGIGSIAGFGLVSFLGEYFFEKFNTSSFIIYLGIGVVLFLTAIWQLYSMMRKYANKSRFVKV